MPRMSEAEKQKSYRRIVEAASRLMREHGIEATSVSDVMKAADMTHGGFYRHFDSKEALVSAAFDAAIEDVLSDLRDAPVGPKREVARAQYLARYLSKEHVNNRARGCPLAALGTEIARQDGLVNPGASEAVEQMADLLGKNDPAAGGRGLATMALLLGTITLARIANSPEFSQNVLDAGKRGCDLLEQHW
jgi:TetR/AcrR family transcriptional regulator, transcriptional repressor for nem operon